MCRITRKSWYYSKSPQNPSTRTQCKNFSWNSARIWKFFWVHLGIHGSENYFWKSRKNQRYTTQDRTFWANCKRFQKTWFQIFWADKRICIFAKYGNCEWSPEILPLLSEIIIFKKIRKRKLPNGGLKFFRLRRVSNIPLREPSLELVHVLRESEHWIVLRICPTKVSLHALSKKRNWFFVKRIFLGFRWCERIIACAFWCAKDFFGFISTPSFLGWATGLTSRKKIVIQKLFCQ